jgi:hypothetical protein
MSQLAEIESIQPDVFAYVSADSYLAKVSKFEIRLERVQTLIDEALSEGTFDPSQAGVLPGAVIEVLMPMVKTENPNAPGPLCTVEQRFIVKENPTVNLAVDENNNPLGTNLTAEMIAARLVRIMHQWGIEGVKTSWYAAPDCITPNRDYLPLVAYDVVVYCTMQFTPLPRAATPTITEPESLTVALACATEGASIYYTTDASAPWSGNPAAVLYTVPFTVPSGTVVRFAAFAPTYIGSAFCRATIT